MFFAWRVGNYSVAAAAAAAATFSVWQFRSYTLAAAAAAAAGYVIYRSVSQSKYEKNMENDVSTWKRAVDAIYLVAEQLDVSEEFDGHTLTIPLLLRIALHASASETEEERLDKVRLPWARETHGLLEPEELKLARVAMRHASAVYGAALLAFFNLTARPSAEELRDLSVHDMDRTCICEYTGVAADDLVVMKTESLDMVGNDSCLSHYVAVDHAAGAVVLALRGTASMSDVLHDAVAHSEPFCGGRAHSGMADMARAVWVEAGHAVLKELDKYPNYRLIITGHSLGAGTALLLNLLLHELRSPQQGVKCLEWVLNKSKPDKQGSNSASEPTAVPLPPPPPPRVAIRCFGFAPPPVFSPLDAARTDAVNAAAAYIVNEDIVPFLSVHAGRRLFAQLYHVDKAAVEMGMLASLQVATGRQAPPEKLRQAMHGAEFAIAPLDEAPRLSLPVSSIVWMHRSDGKSCDADDSGSKGGGRGGGKGGGGKRGDGDGGGDGGDSDVVYTAAVCSARALANLDIKLTRCMVTDHMLDVYAAALASVTEQQ